MSQSEVDVDSSGTKTHESEFFGSLSCLCKVGEENEVLYSSIIRRSEEGLLRIQQAVRRVITIEDLSQQLQKILRSLFLKSYVKPNSTEILLLIQNSLRSP